MFVPLLTRRGEFAEVVGVSPMQHDVRTFEDNASQRRKKNTEGRSVTGTLFFTLVQQKQAFFLSVTREIRYAVSSTRSYPFLRYGAGVSVVKSSQKLSCAS